MAVPNVDLSRCRAGLDFGKGFYLTSSHKQAIEYVPMSVKKNIRVRTIPSNFNVDDGQISIYRFRFDPDVLAYFFEDADCDWLQYISSNRRNGLFPEIKRQMDKFDIICGKVADDDTALVLQNYINGTYGSPGTVMADDLAIRLLLPAKLRNQYCFKTEKAIHRLEYIGSERYGDVKHLYSK